MWRSINAPLWGPEKGTGFLDGGAPWYDTYKTKDDKYMAVGAIEPQFYAVLIKGRSNIANFIFPNLFV